MAAINFTRRFKSVVAYLCALTLVVYLFWSPSGIQPHVPASFARFAAVTPALSESDSLDIARRYLAASSAVKCDSEVVSLPLPVLRPTGATKSGQCDLCALKRPITAVPIRLTYDWIAPQHKPVSWNAYVYDPKDDIHVSASLLSNNGMNGFEAHVKYALYKFVQKSGMTDPLIVDVGANIGIHALFFGALGYRTYAFEPMTTTFNFLACSLAASPNIERMKVFNVGLSDHAHTACMGVDATNRGHAFVDTKATCDNQLTFQTLDHFWETEWNREQVLLMKVDVEGFEPFVFEGAQKMLAAAPPVIVYMEVTPAASKEYGKPVSDFLEKMMALGYEIYDTAAPRDRFPMVKGNEIWDSANGCLICDIALFHRPTMDKLNMVLY